MSENWELGRLFGPEREEVTGGWSKLQKNRIVF
jgi:hypothetical protein